MSAPPSPETVLVTGASSGIGAELARAFARGGSSLVLSARSVDRLEALAAELRQKHGTAVAILPADLAVADGASRLVERLTELRLQIDVLVNNAGYAGFGPFAETDWAHEAGMLQLNVVSLTDLTKRLLPGMVARKRGGLLNLASTAAFQPGPLMAVYYATKAYVLSFSEALAEELRGTGVTVTALCPGATASGFQARAHMEESRLVKGKRLMDAATVAQAGYDGFRRGRRVVIPGLSNRLLAQSVRFTPRRLVTRIVHNMQERVES
ncbi:MAG TPA: SDR family oxidoreductase [Myxococcaceae bacterium]|nr:SDR family oxidoreductase [Myxococcaceae bacterium]